MTGDRRDRLAALGLGADLDVDRLDVLARCARQVGYRAGEHVAREGEPADALLLIESGRMAVEVHHPPRGPVVVATLGPGDVVGWSWLVPPHEWQFDLTAADDTVALCFDGPALRAACDDDPVLGHLLTRRLLGDLGRKLRAARLQLTDVYRRDDEG